MLSSASVKTSHAFQKRLKLVFNVFFAKSTVLCLKVNCKTFFVVNVNGVCLPALDITLMLGQML